MTISMPSRISNASLELSVANAPSVLNRTGTGTTSSRRLKPLAKDRSRLANSVNHAAVVAVVAAAIARVATIRRARIIPHRLLVTRTSNHSTQW